jgi:YfiH family protein
MSSTPSWLQTTDTFRSDTWKHGWSTTAGPDFRGEPDAPDHEEAVRQLVTGAGLTGGAWARQVHGGTVMKADKAGFQGEADALWTDQPGLGVIGRGADCPLILVGGLKSDGRPVWGFAHASWRSTLQGITTGLVLALAEAGADPSGLQAVICPSAGPCCYEVGEEVREKALQSLGPGAAWFFTQIQNRQTFDLWEANIEQLTGAGLSGKNVCNTAHCTICDTGLYPSYRRQGQASGRFAAVIGA